MANMLTAADAGFARRAIASGKATEEEIAFLDTIISLEAAREPVSNDEYRRLQRLTGGLLTVEGSIFDRAAALKPLTDDCIAAACEIHGAKVVSDAAYRRMNGDRAALPKLGLEDPATLGDANRITTICHRLMTPEDKAMDLAQASIDLAKIEPK